MLTVWLQDGSVLAPTHVFTSPKDCADAAATLEKVPMPAAVYSFSKPVCYPVSNPATARHA